MDLLDKMREVTKSLPTLEAFYGYDWDKLVFGMEDGDIITLNPKQISIKYPGDLENAEHAVQDRDFFDVPWRELPPVEVSYDGETFWLEDGHHRWYYATLFRKKLRCEVSIQASPWRFCGIEDPDQFWWDTHGLVRPARATLKHLESFNSFKA